MSALRAVVRALAIPLALVVAVVLQLAVVNRLPLPGGTAPDLVLLVTAAVALCTGPMTGMLAGFCGGLAVDIAPPAAHLAGTYALVFCLVGYAGGRVRNAVVHATGGQPMVTSLTLMALAVAAGEAGKAALGRLLSDPDVTGLAIRHVLPSAILYDLVLCPFVYWLIALVLRRPAPESAPRPEFAKAASAIRVASVGAAGAVPKLPLAGTTAPLARPPVRQQPRLRFAAARSPLSGTDPAFSRAHPAVPGGRTVKLNFAQGAPATPRQWQRAAPGKGWLRGRPPVAAPALRPGSPPKGWLRVRPPVAAPALRPGSPPKGWIRVRPSVAAPALRPGSPPKGWIRPGRPGRPGHPGRSAGTPAMKRRSPGKGWLQAGVPAAAPALRSASPPRGWLHVRPPVGAAAASRRSPGKGWLRPAKPAPPPRRVTPGRRWLRPARPAKLSWYDKSPGTRWVRRSHSPWRGRRRRLLALVGARR